VRVFTVVAVGSSSSSSSSNSSSGTLAVGHNDRFLHLLKAQTKTNK
jgi:hypothetical protein